MTRLKGKLQEIDELGSKMATHFCEDESKFRLEESLGIFHQFCDKVQQCQQVGTQEQLYFARGTFLLAGSEIQEWEANSTAHTSDLCVLLVCLSQTFVSQVCAFLVRKRDERKDKEQAVPHTCPNKSLIHQKKATALIFHITEKLCKLV